MAEVLGPPGYRENAVVRGSGPDPATLRNSSTSVSVTTSSAQRATCFAATWDCPAAVLATILPPSSKPSCRLLPRP